MKTKCILIQICLLAAFLLPAATPKVSAQTIQNTDFETPFVGPPGTIEDGDTYYSFQYNPTGAVWTFTDNAGIAANGSGFAFYNAGTPDGNQFAFLQVYQGVGGSMSQTISNFAAGNYTFTFIASQRDIVGRDVTVNQTVTVLVDDVNVGSFTPADTNWYSCQTTPIPLGAGNHVLTFTNRSAAGDGTVRVDNVALLAPTQLWFNSAVFNGSNLVLGGSNSLSIDAFGIYYVLSSTNITMPLSSWTVIATNAFDANGGFSFTNALNPPLPCQFFALELPPITVANLKASLVTSSSAVVSWTTSGPATGQLNWGANGNPGNGTAQSGYLISHSITLTNLNSFTVYTYYVSGHDQAGNVYQSSKSTFKTTH